MVNRKARDLFDLFQIFMECEMVGIPERIPCHIPEGKTVHRHIRPCHHLTNVCDEILELFHVIVRPVCKVHVTQYQYPVVVLPRLFLEFEILLLRI